MKKDLEKKIKQKWDILNEYGITNVDELRKFNSNVTLDIGILGCRFTKEQIEENRKKYEGEMIK